MKVYKLEIYIPDFDNLGAEEIKDTIENQKYPNYCISPKVIKTEVCDIGEWEDSLPLNNRELFPEAYKNLKFE